MKITRRRLRQIIRGKLSETICRDGKVWIDMGGGAGGCASPRDSGDKGDEASLSDDEVEKLEKERKKTDATVKRQQRDDDKAAEKFVKQHESAISQTLLRQIIREELKIVSRVKAKIAGIKGDEGQSQDEEPLSVEELEAMVTEDPDNRSMGSGRSASLATSRAVSGLGSGVQSYSKLVTILVDGTWHIVVEKTTNESLGGTDRRHLRTLK